MRAAARWATLWALAALTGGCGRRAETTDACAAPPRSPSACLCEPSRFEGRLVAWGAATAGLRLGVAVDGTCVQVRVENVSARPVVAFSHVHGGARPDLEGYTLHLVDAAGAVTAVDLYGGPRRESGPIHVTLAPGRSVRHTVDVTEGGCYPGSPPPFRLRGGYRVIAAYEPRCEPGWWCGHLTSGTASLRAPR